MKAISLLQPWATLIMLGYKQYETRSWATKHRGPLVIHASLGKPKEARQVAEKDPEISRILRRHGLRFDSLPRGVILGEVKVKGMLEIIEPGRGIRLGCCDPDLLKPEERAAGDYTPGRWAWQLAKPIELNKHVPCRGSLSVWQVPAEVAAQFDYLPF